ncbi:MAG: IclR family transcriptional regulator [Gammaproteobacteria bacterium]|nr:IclR family transcriptional regulator [Gammaproteobacteria bacterium]
MAGDQEGVPTILRGLIMLEQVARAQRPISATEITEQMNLPKPSVNRILSQLEEEGFLQREPVKKRYLPGPRSSEFVLSIMSNDALGAPRHSILQELSDEIGETCNCTMLDGSQTVYFDRVEANWPFRIQLPIGSRLPLHCTASGKLFLAYMETRKRQRLITATSLKRYTERSITAPELLNVELEKIKLDGVGIDNEEFMDGMVAVSVPVFNRDNEICFTLAVHAPKIRKSLDELRQYLPSLRKAAASMASSYCGKDQVE